MGIDRFQDERPLERCTEGLALQLLHRRASDRPRGRLPGQPAPADSTTTGASR